MIEVTKREIEMTDIVNIGFAVDSSEVAKGYQRMNKLGKSAEYAETRTERLTASAKDMGAKLATVSTVAAGAVTAISALVYQLGRAEVELMASARMAGLTADEFEAAGFAYKQFGLTVEQVNDIYKDSRERVGQWLTDQTGGLEDFGNAMGMTKDEITEFAREVDGLTGQELLQRMVDDMQAAGVSASQMSFALEGMASEATRMIPALENNGAAVGRLKKRYDEFNASFVLDKDEVEQYSALSESMDLLADTAQNRLVKSLAPLAGVMSEIADDITAVITGSESAESTIKGLEAAFKALSVAGTSYAAVVGVSVVKSMLSSVGATQKQAAATAALELATKKETATKLASDQAKIASEVRMLQAQRANTTQRIIAAKSEAELSSLRTVQANVTARLTAAEAALSAATSKTALAKQAEAVATTAATTAANRATVGATALATATSALGAASRFLLGPWGILLASVGSAAAIFMSTKKSVDEANTALTKQKEKIDLLVSSYDDLTEAGKRNIKVNLIGDLNKTRLETIELQKEIQNLREKSEQAAKAGRSGLFDKEIKRVETQLDINNRKASALVQTFERLRAQDLSSGWKEVKEEVSDISDLFGGTDTVDLFALNQSKAYDVWIESISTTSTKISELKDEILKTQAAIKSGDITESLGDEYIEDLNAQIKDLQSLDVNPFQSMTDGAQDALRAMNGMFESGSKDAKKLAVAMQALNLVQAVGAVLNQGKGDPYTAFGRMASMAAMVASLGMSIGGLSGGLSDASAERQESQGMNQWGEKAESITDATEMTANATSKLVGINTDMLKALQNLSVSVFAAAGIAAKNVTTPSIDRGRLTLDGGEIMEMLDPAGLFDVLFDITGIFGNLTKGLLGKLFGGSSKVRDEGIQIMGGAITDLVDDVLIMSFQEVEYKKWRFGKKKKKTATAQVGDEVSDQFSLVFGSLIESVAVGAEALGLSQKEIEDAINGFNVATQKLSLKGMSVDQQADAINNYFSNVFNGLASEVVPFLDEFQIAGEELGQTLARLATQVSIAEYLTDNLGVSFGDKLADPRAYTEAADNLATLAGGVEVLSEQTGAFTNAFATDAQKFSIYQEAMTSALAEVGLTLPSTAEGMYELMSSLDGTTEAGQEQIATLLGLTDTASAYFKLLDKTAGRYRDAADALYDVSFAVESVALDSALAAAKLGDFSLAEQLDLGSLKPSKSDFGSLLEYNIARAETAAKLNELADLQSGSVSVDEKQLSVLEQIRDKLGVQNESNNGALEKQIANLNKNQELTNDYLSKIAYG